MKPRIPGIADASLYPTMPSSVKIRSSAPRGRSRSNRTSVIFIWYSPVLEYAAWLHGRPRLSSRGIASLGMTGCALRSDDCILQHADAVDLHLELVAGLEPDLRLHPEAD